MEKSAEWLLTLRTIEIISTKSLPHCHHYHHHHFSWHHIGRRTQTKWMLLYNNLTLSLDMAIKLASLHPPHPAWISPLHPHRLSMVSCKIVDCSFNQIYFVFRDSGPDETKIKGYLPKDKQFLYTKNGMSGLPAFMHLCVFHCQVSYNR